MASLTRLLFLVIIVTFAARVAHVQQQPRYEYPPEFPLDDLQREPDKQTTCKHCITDGANRWCVTSKLGNYSICVVMSNFILKRLSTYVCCHFADVGDAEMQLCVNWPSLRSSSRVGLFCTEDKLKTG